MPQINVPNGLIVVTSHGSIRAETASNLISMMRRIEELGLKGIKHDFILNSLVDKARNEGCKEMLKDPQNGWIWFIDGDMMFDAKLADAMFNCAFHECEWADIIGGYCQLRGEPYLPTIDRGSGQWESTQANQGPLEVIRTGAACLLIKRRVFQKMAFPWFGTRYQPRPLDAITEFDNYARCKFDGRNPFSKMEEWQQIQGCAIAERGKDLGGVGEDSNFCDKARALGLRIVVETNAVMGHIDRKIILPEDHQRSIAKGKEQHARIVGVDV